MRILCLAAASTVACWITWTGVVAATPARVRVQLATAAPKGTSYHQALIEMGAKWRTATNGTVDLVVYPGGTQGSEADTVRRMNVGELQAAMLTVGGLAEIDDAVAALQEVPMLFRSLEEAEYVRTKFVPDLERRLRARGYVPLFWTDAGWMRMFSKRPALSPAEFKPLKIFVTASGSESQMHIMQALGYKPVPLDFADALIQLQTGGVDAVPTIPVVALAAQYYTVARHMTELNWVPVVGAAVMTTRAWNAIPEASQPAVLEAAAEAGRKIQERGRRENDEAVATMRARWNLSVHPLTPQLEGEWQAFAESVYPRIRGTIVPAAEFDRARQLVNEYRTRR